jgi:hypothetical protein
MATFTVASNEFLGGGKEQAEYHGSSPGSPRRGTASIQIDTMNPSWRAGIGRGGFPPHRNHADLRRAEMPISRLSHAGFIPWSRATAPQRTVADRR